MNKLWYVKTLSSEVDVTLIDLLIVKLISLIILNTTMHVYLEQMWHLFSCQKYLMYRGNQNYAIYFATEGGSEHCWNISSKFKSVVLFCKSSLFYLLKHNFDRIWRIDIINFFGNIIDEETVFTFQSKHLAALQASIACKCKRWDLNLFKLGILAELLLS